MILGPEPLQKPTLDLARELLGAHLVRIDQGKKLVGRIVEVEAYRQDGDRASHSFGGQTKRNAVMFGPPGRLYVYFIYGMHHCMNIVTEPEGVGAAILIRAMEPLVGIEFMQANRGAGVALKNLTNGPAKCCRAFGVDLSANGWPLCGPDLFLEKGQAVERHEIAASERIGISKSTELEWRFYLKNNPFVSKTKR